MTTRNNFISWDAVLGTRYLRADLLVAAIVITLRLAAGAGGIAAAEVLKALKHIAVRRAGFRPLDHRTRQSYNPCSIRAWRKPGSSCGSSRRSAAVLRTN
jgi:hypothetical protein